MRRTLVTLAMLCLPAMAMAAGVPYSGQVSEAGSPVTGTRLVTLTVYDAASGGAVLHTQSGSLSVQSGIFHTTIDAPDAIWTGADRWVGVRIESEPELVPRVKVGWVPYAIHAGPGPSLVTRPPVTRTVTDVWTAVDSITVVAPTSGLAIVQVTGSGLWSGSISQSGASLAILATTPTDGQQALRAISGSDALSLTYMDLLPAGARTYYFWARALGAGQTYSISAGLFQAAFLPR